MFKRSINLLVDVTKGVESSSPAYTHNFRQISVIFKTSVATTRVVDIFSKYAWVVALKTKQDQKTSEGFSNHPLLWA